MTTNFYKNLILEAFNKANEFSKFAQLHNDFLETLKRVCVGCEKNIDTFSNKLKNTWIRQYTFDCSDTNSVKVTIINQRKSVDDESYNKWNVRCYCEYSLGKLTIDNSVAYKLLDIFNNYKINQNFDILSSLKTLCNSQSNSSGIDDQQAKSMLLDTLKVQHTVSSINDGLVVSIGPYRISFIQTDSRWNVVGEIVDKIYGNFELTEQSAKKFEQCLRDLTYQYPDHVFEKMKLTP